MDDLVETTYTCEYKKLPWVLEHKLGLPVYEANRPYHRNYLNLMSAALENRIELDDLKGNTALMEDIDTILASPFIESLDYVLGLVTTKWGGQKDVYRLDKIINGMTDEARERIAPYTKYSLEDLQQLLSENLPGLSPSVSIDNDGTTVCIKTVEVVLGGATH